MKKPKPDTPARGRNCASSSIAGNWKSRFFNAVGRLVEEVERLVADDPTRTVDDLLAALRAQPADNVDPFEASEADDVLRYAHVPQEEIERRRRHIEWRLEKGLPALDG